jgi:hypothetical protein
MDKEQDILAESEVDPYGIFIAKPIATPEEFAAILPHRVPAPVLRETQDFLQLAGKRDREGVVVWIGKQSAGAFEITRALVPQQTASRYHFEVPLAERIRIVLSLAAEELVVAQVHSHPEEAFHSPTDDRKAIVDRQWALSLVVPEFCHAGLPNLNASATFALRGPLDWVQLSQDQIRQVFIIG